MRSTYYMFAGFLSLALFHYSALALYLHSLGKVVHCRRGQLDIQHQPPSLPIGRSGFDLYLGGRRHS
jgi:hypothetical protein